MSLHWFETQHFIRRNLGVCLLIIIQCIVCLLVSVIMLSSTLTMVQSVKGFETFFLNKEYYLLTDTGDSDGTFQEYCHSENGWKNLSGFLQELRSQNNFDFISTVGQPLSLSDKTLDEKFRDGQSQDTEFRAKCMQLSDNVWDLFNLQIETGREFFAEEYDLKKEKNIPVVLGFEYHNVINIGDVFTASHGSDEMSYEVVGFLKNDSIIPAGGTLINLNTYMVIPAFHTYDPVYMEYATFNISQQANGAIVTERKELNLTQYINALSQKHNTMNFIVSPIVSTNSKEISSLAKDVANQMKVLSIVVFASTIVSVLFSLYSRIRRDAYILGTHYLCGATKQDISGIIRMNLLVLLGIPTVLSTVIAIILSKFNIIIIPIFIPLFGLVLFIILYRLLMIFIDKMQVSQMLRRNYE